VSGPGASSSLGTSYGVNRAGPFPDGGRLCGGVRGVWPARTVASARLGEEGTVVGRRAESLRWGRPSSIGRLRLRRGRLRAKSSLPVNLETGGVLDLVSCAQPIRDQRQLARTATAIERLALARHTRGAGGRSSFSEPLIRQAFRRGGINRSAAETLDSPSGIFCSKAVERPAEDIRRQFSRKDGEVLIRCRAGRKEE